MKEACKEASNIIESQAMETAQAAASREERGLVHSKTILNRYCNCERLCREREDDKEKIQK